MSEILKQESYGEPLPRERAPFDLAKGERDLLALALREYAAARQRLIDEAWAKHVQPYTGRTQTNARSAKEQRERAIFEDHKRHHVQQIDAADRLAARLAAWKGGAR